MKFIGIDVHKDGLMVACINENLEILILEEMTREEFYKFASEEKIQIIAIDAPLGPNIGLMDDEIYRKNLDTNINGHYNKKVSEYKLSKMGIRAFSTPKNLGELVGWKSWMKIGFELNDRLISMGYHKISSDRMDNVERGIIEVFPHGSFKVLLGKRPEKKSTIEGINQRKSILEEVGFSDIDKYLLNISRKLATDKLDSLIGAYTALKIFKKQSVFVGDSLEGEIALPLK
ncbi:MAG: DUF429 domain-containing protein [Firmicutes bacterium]|jgi:hypothetical protein|nr:DUF429 domain-containing protein [Bacillota bacterium]